MFKNILPGLMFAILWSTGAIGAKFGIRSADGLMLASIRFICTGLLFSPLFLIHPKHRFLPKRNEWKPIFIYGFLNSTATLGSFFAAQKYSPAGISMLFTAVTPLLIALLSSIFLKRKLTRFEVGGMLISFTGLIVASLAALPNASIKPLGILLLVVYVTAYASSSIYLSNAHMSLSRMVFNIWQVFVGGVMLLPFCWLFNAHQVYKVDVNLLLSLAWLILVLSFVANMIWMYLVKRDPVTAASWLYLVPVFGYLFGYLLLGESITLYSVIGTMLVIIGLVISKRKNGSTAQSA
ncbi:DMT family transporter [Mucilaginibacter aquatilis]|uniref:EamA family transporter n=1 Tax=Mucilaginibacter aquatilis TaxID=1517760 RepID=A0A6I4I4T9_9SPHI|nr:DMT family transporter [Mucilaginibacter aquatilis]MVN90142.1 EamA family transporter [Mucilaginibacter aquatilis]